MSRITPNNVFYLNGYFDGYVENVNKLVYWSDKCKYENQGEEIARANFEPYMYKIMALNSTEIDRISAQEYLTENLQYQLLL